MSVSVTPEDVTNVATEFASVSDETISMYIEYARLYVDEGTWGKKAKLAIIFMTAHLMKRLGVTAAGGVTSAAGPITQEAVGSLSRSYANVAPSDSDASEAILGTTAYGQEYLRLRKSLVISPLVV